MSRKEQALNKTYLTYIAYFYWLKEEPLPVDLYIQLNIAGVNPECLLTQFAEGEIPCDESCDTCICAECADEEMDCPLFI
jgi:hypothetical protein